MRIILKPAGLVVLVAAIGLLALLAFKGRGGGAGPTVASADAGGSPVAVASPGVTSSVTQIAANASPAAVVHTLEHALINPSPVTQNWGLIAPVGDTALYAFPCNLPGVSQFRRISIAKPPLHAWDVQIRQVIEHPIALGAHLRVRVWARSKDACPFSVVCEQSGEPYAKLMVRDLQTTANWQQFDVDWIADREVKPGWAELDLQCGAKAGQIDIASVSMVSSTATS